MILLEQTLLANLDQEIVIDKRRLQEGNNCDCGDFNYPDIDLG